VNRISDPLPGIKKIAVLRANGIGDYVFCLPAVASLRAAYPSSEIVLLGKSWHRDFLANRPGPVDRVVVIPRSTGVNEALEWEPSNQEETLVEAEFFEMMRQEAFDLAIQMHGGGRNSNPFVQNLGARITAGMKTPDAVPLDYWIPYIYWQNEIMRYLELVTLVGAQPVTFHPELKIIPKDIEDSDHIFEADMPVVVLHPGASDPRRRWDPECFARVGDILAREGYRIAITGSTSDQQIGGEVARSMQNPALNLCGKLTLNGLAGLMARAALVIGNDSGPLHLAEAFDTPTVGIFWCGNLINAGIAFRSAHPPLLSWRLNCPVCGSNTITNPCDHRVSFVSDVTAEAVLDQAEDLLSQKTVENRTNPESEVL
jgi:ADP-heptose:LPS heptosyltransferase